MFFGKQQRLRVREDMLLVVALLIISLTTYAQNTTTKTLSEVSLDSLKFIQCRGLQYMVEGPKLYPLKLYRENN
jgi:vitamin B12 transporter